MDFLHMPIRVKIWAWNSMCMSVILSKIMRSFCGICSDSDMSSNIAEGNLPIS